MNRKPFPNGIWVLALLLAVSPLGCRRSGSSGSGAAAQGGSLGIHRVIPSDAGSLGGTQVTLFGFGFDDGTVVLFGGLEDGILAETDFVNGSLLKVTTPAHPAGTVVLTLITGRGELATFSGLFEFRDELSLDPLADDDGDGRSNGDETAGHGIFVDETGFGPEAAQFYVVTSDPFVTDTDSDALDDLAELRAKSHPRRIGSLMRQSRATQRPLSEPGRMRRGRRGWRQLVSKENVDERSRRYWDLEKGLSPYHTLGSRGARRSS